MMRHGVLCDATWRAHGGRHRRPFAAESAAGAGSQAGGQLTTGAFGRRWKAAHPHVSLAALAALRGQQARSPPGTLASRGGACSGPRAVAAFNSVRPWRPARRRPPRGAPPPAERAREARWPSTVSDGFSRG
jgi:hypothetical protein